MIQIIEIQSESEEEESAKRTTQDFFAKKGNEGPKLREFEAIDLIHENLRKKTEDGLDKCEPLIKKQLHSLYYDRKANLYILNKEKRKLDDLNVERLIRKTLVPVNLLTQEEEELK